MPESPLRAGRPVDIADGRNRADCFIVAASVAASPCRKDRAICISSNRISIRSVKPPCKGPDSAANAPVMAAPVLALVDAMQRAVKLDAFNSWSAHAYHALPARSVSAFRIQAPDVAALSHAKAKRLVRRPMRRQRAGAINEFLRHCAYVEGQTRFLAPLVTKSEQGQRALYCRTS